MQKILSQPISIYKMKVKQKKFKLYNLFDLNEDELRHSLSLSLNKRKIKISLHVAT
jgi:hypothetical protein